MEARIFQARDVPSSAPMIADISDLIQFFQQVGLALRRKWAARYRKVVCRVTYDRSVANMDKAYPNLTMEDPMFSRLLMAAGIAVSLTPTLSLAAERLVVVELFTSQGCSSCPPANAYLNELARGRRDILPLAFHVTYWDRLGWKDPFSLEEATQRQGRYGHRFGDGSYTPEMVVEGKSSHVGSYRDEIASAIERAKRDSQTAASVIVKRQGERLSIEVGGGSGSGKVLLIGFDHDHQTAIRRGENGGRTLEEANVVRSIRSIGDWRGMPLAINEACPEGQDFAVILEGLDGRIVGAGRLAGG